MISADLFQRRYFHWLKQQAFATRQRQDLYSGVMETLYDIPFYWDMDLDGDRAADATAYRKYERYVLDQEPHSLSKDWLDRWEQATPSVLEVLVAIAERWSQYYDKPIPFFFNHLFRNMGLQQFRGLKLRHTEEEAIRWAMDNWMNRQIERNGEGSPFPIRWRHDSVDMRELDIWSQMSAYSRDHFQ